MQMRWVRTAKNVLVTLALCFVHVRCYTAHTNNWAVLVCTSRFWFNYRHVANTLSMYHIIKEHGIPDSNIIMMLADDMPCNPRNIRPASVLNHDDGRGSQGDIYGSNVEVDYRGEDVNVENFIRVLTGRHHKDTPASKRLLTDSNSNVLVYLSGHGGDEFLKFQDSEEISSVDFADAVEQMRIQQRYNELLFVSDTCQAATLNNHFYSDDVIAVGSSLKGQNSYSHHMDAGLGVAIMDRFSYYTGNFFQQHKRNTDVRLTQLFEYYTQMVEHIKSDVGIRTDLLTRPLGDVKLMDFFGSVQQTSVLERTRATSPVTRATSPPAQGDQKAHLNPSTRVRAAVHSVASKAALGSGSILHGDGILSLGTAGSDLLKALMRFFS